VASVCLFACPHDCGTRHLVALVSQENALLLILSEAFTFLGYSIHRQHCMSQETAYREHLHQSKLEIPLFSSRRRAARDRRDMLADWFDPAATCLQGSLNEAPGSGSHCPANGHSRRRLSRRAGLSRSDIAPALSLQLVGALKPRLGDTVATFGTKGPAPQAERNATWQFA
jgi:hypothetical protein